jgi:hypothetical protein
MNVQDILPSLLIHIDKCLVAQESGIVDQDIHAAVSSKGGINDLLSVFTAPLTSGCFATSRTNFDDCWSWVCDITNDDGGAEGGRGFCVAAT